MSILICQHDSARPPGRMTRLLAGYAIRFDIRALDRSPVLPPDLDDIDAIISLDTPSPFASASASPWFKNECDLVAAAHAANRPVIGVGFGAELIAHALGGQVIHTDPPPALGWCEARLTFPGTVETILAGQPWRSHQFLTRTDHIEKLPPGAAPLMTSPDRRTRAFKAGVRTYAFEFNLESEQNDLVNGELIPPGPNRPRADEVKRDTKMFFADYDRLSTRIIRSLADYLLPITRPVRT